MTEEEIKAYIEGDNSKPNKKIEEEIKAKQGYNLAAAIIGLPYYIYRKQYTAGLRINLSIFILFILVNIAANFITGNLKPDISMIVTYGHSGIFLRTVTIFMTMMMNGYSFYLMYKRNMENIIKETRGNIEEIKELGGTDIVGACVFSVLNFIVLLIYIATYFRFYPL